MIIKHGIGKLECCFPNLKKIKWIGSKSFAQINLIEKFLSTYEYLMSIEIDLIDCKNSEKRFIHIPNTRVYHLKTNISFFSKNTVHYCHYSDEFINYSSIENLYYQNFCVTGTAYFEFPNVTVAIINNCHQETVMKFSKLKSLELQGVIDCELEGEVEKLTLVNVKLKKALKLKIGELVIDNDTYLNMDYLPSYEKLVKKNDY